MSEARDILWRQLGYKPSLEQQIAHDAPVALKIVAGGERSGKSFSAGKEAAWQIMQFGAMQYQEAGPNRGTLARNDGLWWVIGPTYELARPEFQYIADDFIRLGVINRKNVSVPKEGACEIRLPWGLVVTKSGEDARKIAAKAPDGILVCETAQLDYYTWLKILGRAIEKRAWVWASGCITGDSLVDTDIGIKRLSELSNGTAIKPVDIGVMGTCGPARASHVYCDGATKTIIVETTKGFKIEGTPNHLIYSIRPGGTVGWVSLEDLTTDDFVAIHRGVNIAKRDTVIRDPYLLGLFVAEGCASESDRITITTADKEVEDRLGGFFKHNYHWRKTDHELCDYWRSIGVKFARANAKELPTIIMESARHEDVIEFLRGLFDGDGCAHKNGNVTYTTASYALAKQLQILLLSLGIVASLQKKTDWLNGNSFDSYVLDLGTDSLKFYDTIGFGLSRKQARRSSCRAVAQDLIPYQRERVKALYKTVPRKRGRGYDKWRHIVHDKKTIGIPKQAIAELISERTERDETLEWLTTQDIYWARVVRKADSFAQCYDLVVPDEKSYTANGFIVHNTFEGSLGWYPEKWREWQGPNAMGGKSFSIPTWSNLSIFPEGRDNPEIKKLEVEYPPDMFMERFGAIPCPPATLVFKEFSHMKHVVKMTMAKEFGWIYNELNELEAVELPWEHEVQVWIDPGRWGYAVEAVIIIGEHVFNFDEVFCTEMSAEQVIKECEKKSWWRRVKIGVMDIAGAQKHAGMSHKEIWISKAGIPIVDQRVGITDGIDRHRTFLDTGRLFHSPNCTNAIKEYGLYKYRDVKDDNRPRSDIPLDANNHCVVGDTKIDTPGGRKKIKELVGTTPWVYCCIGGKVAVRKARDIRLTRKDAQVVTILMDRDELTLTADHLVMLLDGSYKPACELKSGDRLMAMNRFVSNDGYTRICMTNQTAHNISEHRYVYEHVYGKIPQGFHIHHKDMCQWNNEPDNLVALSIEDHASVHHNGKTISDEQKDMIRERSLEWWADDPDDSKRDMARRNIILAHEANTGRSPTDETRAKISVASRKAWNANRKKSWSDNQMGRKHTDQAKDKVRQAKIAYWQSEKGQEHKKRLAEMNRLRGKNHKVIAVIDAGYADVYNMEVDEAENYVADGVVVHNCMKAFAYGLVYNFGYVKHLRDRPLYEWPFTDPAREAVYKEVTRPYIPAELR